MEKLSDPHLDATEDIEVYLFPKEKVKEMLQQGEFMQALMVAPLYRYFSGCKQSYKTGTDYTD